MFSIFKSSFERDKERFLWVLAEALLWRDDCPSLGAIPSPIKEQPDAKRYYADAKYILNYVLSKTKEKQSGVHKQNMVHVLYRKYKRTFW
jgi:hypothetical protein